MNYKDILIQAGFKWDEEKELWIKRMGFGQTLSVEKMFRNLFTIRRNCKGTGQGEVLFDGYINSFNEYKQLIKDKT